MVAQHIANGMYGRILVEPADGLPPVDREFYVMQGELYTTEPIGTNGELTEDYDALVNEMPTHFVFNGRSARCPTRTRSKQRIARRCGSTSVSEARTRARPSR
jgi:hypothetical protein